MNYKKRDLPAMPFYIGDWKKDPAIQMLTREEKMIWLEMLFLMWESSERGYLTVNGKPIDNFGLALALNLDNHLLEVCLNKFEGFGLFSRRENDGAIFSRKIVKMEEISKKRSESGRKGGNPQLKSKNLVKQKSSKSQNHAYPNAENCWEKHYPKDNYCRR